MYIKQHRFISNCFRRAWRAKIFFAELNIIKSSLCSGLLCSQVHLVQNGRTVYTASGDRSVRNHDTESGRLIKSSTPICSNQFSLFRLSTSTEETIVDDIPKDFPSRAAAKIALCGMEVRWTQRFSESRPDSCGRRSRPAFRGSSTARRAATVRVATAGPFEDVQRS